MSVQQISQPFATSLAVICAMSLAKKGALVALEATTQVELETSSLLETSLVRSFKLPIFVVCQIDSRS